jgi:hypothetical protein
MNPVVYHSLGRHGYKPRLENLGRHLVYSEGTVTEINYIYNIRDLIALKSKVNQGQIVAVRKRRGMATNELVDFAEHDVEKRRKKGETINYVWIFFDKDSFSDFDAANKRIFLKNDDGDSDRFGTEWCSCWSNECFELWLYFYFHDLSSSLHREQYLPKINSFLNPSSGVIFEKNTPEPHTFLVKHGGSLQSAINFAEKKDADPIGCSPKPNPSSGVYKFARHIVNYL